ncbi:uncharacterized protein LOC106155915 [Lingula anatina]|uniref:Uncharacterized protein LOC106155915 n=1 Tax=Lingula anatina TaxID=7574 RepID=A0A1S3HMX6_LINAN|nr:uncharacterized protein LOC106155915 [Lingula anatina]|eukprot:XP_013386399.1 uncharacterized protein LOC106155915 [Lingula anatina]
MIASRRASDSPSSRKSSGRGGSFIFRSAAISQVRHQERLHGYWTQLMQSLLGNTTVTQTTPKVRAEKRQIELNVYLDQIVSEKVPELERQERRNFEKVQAITNRLLTVAWRGNRRCNAYFEDPGLATQVETYQALDVDTFDCRMFVKGFEIPGSFQPISGLNHDVPPGYAFFCVNERFTRGEKISVRTAWQDCIDGDGFLMPGAIYPFFAKAIKDALQYLQDKGDKDMKKVLMIETKPSLVLKILTDEKEEKEGEDKNNTTSKSKESDSDEEEEKEEKKELTVNIVIACKGYNWPQGATIQQPLPKQKPYCELGRQCLADIDDAMSDGASMWYLEARPVSLSKTLQNSRCHANVSRNPVKCSRLWKFCFAPVEDHFFKTICSFRGGVGAPATVIRVLQLMIANGEVQNSWKPLNQHVLRTLMFWQFKKHAAKIKTFPECFFMFLGLLQQCLQGMSCPHFLLPNLNIMESIDSSCANVMKQEIAKILESLEQDTTNLLIYTGIKQRDEEPDQEQGETVNQ